VAGLTPFQTVGPYLHLGLRVGLDTMTASGEASSIVLQGRLLDGAGDGIPDGVLEFWAAGFQGIGRAWTGPEGGYRLETRKPPARTDENGRHHAPHFAVRVLARGILTQYLTRVYFADDAGHDRDVVLAQVSAERRPTMIASGGASASEYRFDVVVQGERETVFFDW
jgi:protocatechuate 3,4-dioxygenase, alpha subunit